MNKKENWKHGIYIPPTQKPDAVAVFDDEDADCDSLYYKYGEKFSPCRTVDRTSHRHWESVLLAWACKAPLLDLRNDKTTPLPGKHGTRSAFVAHGIIPFDPTLNVENEGRPNGERANTGRSALLAYAHAVNPEGDAEKDVENDAETQISDLLADLMHFAHREGLPFQDLIERATTNFTIESGGQVFAE